MMLVFWAEWLRFRRGRVNLIIVATYCGVLLLSGLWAAHGAHQHRQFHVLEEAARDSLISEARQSGAATSPEAAAMQAFTLGRSKAGLAQLPAPPGLALNLSQYDVLNTRIAVSVESRYADSRRSDAIANPALAHIGGMDLAAIVVLLMPLVAIGLCAGAVQEDRERGVWRTARGQTASLWRSFGIGQIIRAAAVFAPAACGCALVLAFDAGGAAWPTAAWWGVCLAAYACFWVALCGVLALLPISSAAAVLTSLAIWLMLTFAIPAGLESLAAARHPIPSRLAAIVQMREIQQDAEVRMPELLEAWYARHPEWKPEQAHAHTWPVTFLPRFAYQDERLRPLMQRFERQRLAQAQYLERWAWLTPPMALLQIADHLAGISAARYSTFMRDVDQYEQAWRSFLVPRVMSYRGLSAVDYPRIPKFDIATPRTMDAVPALLGKLVLGVGVLLVVLLVLWPWAVRRQ